MRNRTSRVRVSLFAVALCASLTAPVLVRAQIQPDVQASRQPVSIKLEKADLPDALKQLFGKANISYTLDEAVKGTVTASLEDTPFQSALELVLRAAPMPLTYRVERGIYEIIPKSKDLQEAVDNRPRLFKLHPNNATATAIVQKLKTMSQFGPDSGITYQVNPGDNTILATAEGEERYIELQEAIHLLDVTPREVAMKAEVILVAGKGDKNHKAVVAMTGRTVSEGTVKMQTTTDGKAVSNSPIIVSSGDYNVTLKPTINGDDSIQVEAEVNLDITYRLPGDSKPQHLHQKFTGSGRYLSGDTILLSSMVLKSQSGKAQANDAELLIFITPNLIQPRTQQQPVPGGNSPTPASTKSGGKRESPNAPPTRKE